jgi:sugar lactone lactonase YvrE
VALVLAAGIPGVARADGAWSTFIRAYRANDLLAEGDTVWCATLEAGLLRFSRAAHRFEPIVHEPGGLASNHLTALARDRSRRLWVGTQGAGASVLRADGSGWTLVNTFDGLPSDTVTAIEAAGDTMWIGTAGGLAFWNGVEIAGALPDGANPSPFASNFITGIEVMRDTIWVATTNGLYRSRVSALLSGAAAPWTLAISGFIHSSVRAMAANDSTVFALDSVFVRRWDASSNSWLVINGTIGPVQGLFDDRERVMVASGRGIFQWNGAQWDTVTTTLVSTGDSRRSFARDFVVGLDERGRVAAMNQTGIYVQPVAGDRGPWPGVLPDGPPGNDVYNLALDRGRLYVNTPEEGVGRYDGASWKYWFPPAQLVIESDTTLRRPSFAHALQVDADGRKWIACWDFALDVLDDSGTLDAVVHQWPRTYPVTQPDTVRYHTWAWCSTVDGSGGLWFGMDANGSSISLGLESYDAAGNYVANYRPSNSLMRGSVVHALTTDRNGRVWVGYKGQGIDYFNLPAGGGRPIFTAVRNTDNLSVSGLVAQGDALWALTSRELQRYSLSGDLELTYDLPDPPANFASRPMDIASDGTIWIGTSNGVYVLDLDGTLRHLNQDNSPLAGNDVRAVQVDPGGRLVWFGTGEGISRYDRRYVPPPLALPELRMSIFPNPAHQTGLGVRLRVLGNASGLNGAIFDLGGRVVRRFTTRANGEVVWDGRDEHGELMNPGIYFVRAEAGGRVAVARVVLLH